MKLGVVGTGYVGLVSGACFSDFGHDVICIDKDKEKIENLRNGVMPIYEPGLKAIVDRNLNSGRLKFETKLKSYLSEINVLFIAVGTPSRRGDGYADLTSLFAVVNEILVYSANVKTIVIKSTVPVGTNRDVYKLVNSKKNGIRHYIVSNPEFLREGSAIDDFMKPDRVIVGLKNKKAKK